MLTDPGHNTINVGVVVAPLTAFFINVSPVITGILAIVGLVWYGVLFYDRFVKKNPTIKDI